jgi:hypothetical protein
MFHKLCDDKPVTITFIRVKETEEILGGYNPSTWFTPFTCTSRQINDCFIFF